MNLLKLRCYNFFPEDAKAFFNIVKVMRLFLGYVEVYLQYL